MYYYIIVLLYYYIPLLFIPETGALARQKRRYTSAASIMSNKVLMSVYNRMVEVIDTLAQLLGTQALTDMTVLKVRDY